MPRKSESRWTVWTWPLIAWTWPSRRKVGPGEEAGQPEPAGLLQVGQGPAQTCCRAVAMSRSRPPPAAGRWPGRSAGSTWPGTAGRPSGCAGDPRVGGSRRRRGIGEGRRQSSRLRRARSTGSRRTGAGAGQAATLWPRHRSASEEQTGRGRGAHRRPSPHRSTHQRPSWPITVGRQGPDDRPIPAPSCSFRPIGSPSEPIRRRAAWTRSRHSRRIASGLRLRRGFARLDRLDGLAVGERRGVGLRRPPRLRRGRRRPPSACRR